jgi:hypothetical protein
MKRECGKLEKAGWDSRLLTVKAADNHSARSTILRVACGFHDQAFSLITF